MFQGFTKQSSVHGDESPGVLEGSELESHLAWEELFRRTLREHGFQLLNLPTILPSYRFKSELTGESLLPLTGSFRDGRGQDWLLRSDMTAFSAQAIRRAFSKEASALRVGYCGKVFGVRTREEGGYLSRAAHGLGPDGVESFEYGAEIIDRPCAAHEFEALRLVLELARSFGYSRPTLVVGHSEVWHAVLKAVESKERFASRPRARLIAEIRSVFLRRDGAALAQLGELEPVVREALESSGLRELCEKLEVDFPDLDIQVDPLLLRSSDFYSGLTFELFAQVPGTSGSPSLARVGAGGRYDQYLEHFGMKASAVGFKIFDPGTARRSRSAEAPVLRDQAMLPSQSERPLRIAVPKGRLMKQVLECFAVIGLEPEQDPAVTRRLVLPSRRGHCLFLFVKNTDVPSYLESGGADVGICGSDVLDESGCGLARPLTFRFGQTRLCLAGIKGGQEDFWNNQNLVVASKYGRTARRLLEDLGFEASVVPLQGSVELASVLGIAGAVVDLVETGRTLEENGLELYKELTTTKVQLLVSQDFWVGDKQRLRDWHKTWLEEGLVHDSGLVLREWDAKGGQEA